MEKTLSKKVYNVFLILVILIGSCFPDNGGNSSNSGSNSSSSSGAFLANKITLGKAITCVIKTDNTLWCWGKNQYGEFNQTENDDTFWCWGHESFMGQDIEKKLSLQS